VQALVSGAGSLVTTFLSGNWVAVVFHPLVLLILAFSTGMGWAYHKGKQHERRAQASAIVALNNEVIDWRKQYEAADTQAEIRLQKALEEWRKNTGTTAVIASTCKLPPNAVRTISDIAGD
jgi:cbb3-type cytochrome oxidase subunit 3